MLFFPHTSQAGSGADFLIVAHVDRLQIYNKYQQVATPQDLHLLAPFAPMRIIKANDLLGDGFTRCMQVEVSGQTFFLLKDADNRISRTGPLGFERSFSNTTLLLDTVEALAAKSLRISPEESPASYLSRGDLALRIFRHGKLTYCQTLTGDPVHGWIDFNENGAGKTWGVFNRLASGNASLSPNTIHKIETRIAGVNRALTHLYDFFNRQTHQNKTPPQWHVEESNSYILCALDGAPNGEAFEQSTFYLVNEIENNLLGSEFHVTHSPGRIEIRNR